MAESELTNAGTGSTTGKPAVTTVPLFEEEISSSPPSCRMRSFIPRNPTPMEPIQLRFDWASNSGGMPLPLSAIDHRTSWKRLVCWPPPSLSGARETRI